MSVTWLAWYVSVLLALIAVLTSLITYHPDSEHLEIVLPRLFGVAAILASVVGV